MAAKALMVQGTASHVGKSVLTTALCRLFARRGMRVAPFKAQNMSNNSFVTPEGDEIGRAQAVQAAACGLAPHRDFNPVLIKPAGEASAQLIVGGTVAGQLSTKDFGRVRREYAQTIFGAFDRLAGRYDLVILEGAGSPAEINLREHDIVNMPMAQHARAPVLLVGDIDRGGVFASLVGTLDLLEPEARRLVRGLLINKFRGDAELLSPGIRMLTERTGVNCLGVLPHWGALAVPEEDSFGWDAWRVRQPCDEADGNIPDGTLRIGVVDLPYLSNSTDLDALAREPDVRLLRLSQPTTHDLDALIVPGTKSTAQALRFLRERMLDQVAERVIGRGGTVVGLCGGFQILGRRVLDPLGVESTHQDLPGLGLLNATTVFGAKKTTSQVEGRHRASGCPIHGYEVHMGRTQVTGGVPFLDVRAPSETAYRPEGVVSENGLVVGTYVHGLFDACRFRRTFLNGLRSVKGWPPLACVDRGSLDDDLDRLADFVETHVDLPALERLVEHGV